MFYTIEELVQQADNLSGNVAELMIATEIELTGRSRRNIDNYVKKLDSYESLHRRWTY